MLKAVRDGTIDPRNEEEIDKVKKSVTKVQII